jgi:hypothetical protein
MQRSPKLAQLLQPSSGGRITFIGYIISRTRKSIQVDDIGAHGPR